jgi:uncharacterized DUF497 family protein
MGLGELRITGYIWLDEIVDKLAWKHRVEPYEVEEVFAGASQFRFVENGNRRGEDVYLVLGQADSGRYLVAFFVLKEDGRALLLSARDMTPAERKRYGRA